MPISLRAGVSTSTVRREPPMPDRFLIQGIEAYVPTLDSIGLRKSYLMNRSGSMEVRGLHPFWSISMGMLQHTAPSPSLYRAGTR